MIKDNLIPFLEDRIFEYKNLLPPRAPGADRMIEFLEVVLLKYTNYFPSNLLLKGLNEIEKDKYFKHPISLTKEDLAAIASQFDDRLNLVLWKENILHRFSYYALAKACCEEINTRFSSETDINRIHENFLFFQSFWEMKIAGVKNFGSLTANSRNQKDAKTITFPSVNPLVDLFNSFIDPMGDLLQAAINKNMSSEQIIEHYDELFKFDITLYQKRIFSGIFEEFEVTKIGRNKVQSKRHKALLLLPLFNLTHPKCFYDVGSKSGAKTPDDYNYKAILKIVE